MKKKLTMKEIAKKSSKIKVNKNLNSIDDDSPFLKEKMNKAMKIIATVGLPE